MMRRKFFKGPGTSTKLSVVAFAMFIGMVAACHPSIPAAAHLSLTSLEPLRTAFNADSGKVRAIFLASPT
jgi:hypothetical protein